MDGKDGSTVTAMDERHFRLTGSNALEGRSISILVLNPNSSVPVTRAMAACIEKRGVPPSTILVCATAPPASPPVIVDPSTSATSTSACLDAFANSRKEGGDLVFNLARYDAVLVACFSAHPLVPALRHLQPSKPSMHILEAALSAALSATSGRFGILTTGQVMADDIDAGVCTFLGSPSSRYVGAIATGLGVLHFNDPLHGITVVEAMVHGAKTLSKRGAHAIILGCAGMTGMEGTVRSGMSQEGGPLTVIDGTIAGVHLLAGLARSELTV